MIKGSRVEDKGEILRCPSCGNFGLKVTLTPVTGWRKYIPFWAMNYFWCYPRNFIWNNLLRYVWPKPKKFK